MSVFLFWTFLAIHNIYGQSVRAIELEKKVYQLNNQFEYNASQNLIHQFVESNQTTNEDKYHAYIYLSYTYKRLFDYPSVFRYLDTALVYGIQTEVKDYSINNILCQKALAHFDIHNYNQADSLMSLLALNKYAHLNDEYKSKIMMQEAYLLYLDKEYPAAEKRYDNAIEIMKQSCACDLPMIYGKKIQLYGTTKNESLLNQNYHIALHSADSCKIVKYTLYIKEMMSQALFDMGNYKKAYEFFLDFKNSEITYNSKEHLDKIDELEKKFQVKRKEQELIIKQKDLENSKTQRLLLLVALIGISLVSIIAFLWQRQKQLKKEQLEKVIFTNQLLQRTEEERKRIAGDLHDGIGHELLSLKNASYNNPQELQSKIDDVLNDVRNISRNLHPVMFETIGLQASIENMVERLQQQYQFPISTEITYSNSLQGNNELQIFRIIQEALNNIIKYASAFAAKVSITETNTSVKVEILDNGNGFNVEEKLKGGNAYGLHSIIERSKSIGGNAIITSSQKGTTITLELPKQ